MSATSSAGATSAPRTRTPPELKWLLNERAAVAGALEKALARHAQLQQRIERAQHQLAQAKLAAETSSPRLPGLQAALASLDTTIQLVSSTVDCEAGGVVRAWQGKYGARGALGAFLLQALKGAAPAALTTTSLTVLAAQHFGLSLETSQERNAFIHTVRSRLGVFYGHKQVEPLHDTQATYVGYWRWVGDRVPTMADLAALQAGAAHDRDPSPHPHPPRNQMAGK